MLKTTSQKLSGEAALILDNLRHEALNKLGRRMSKQSILEAILIKIISSEQCKKELWKYLKEKAMGGQKG